MASAIELYLLATTYAQAAAASWTTVTMINGWANGTGANSPLRYRLSNDGTSVIMSGVLIGASASTSAFGSLPSGYYNTTYTEQVPAIASGGTAAGYVQIDSSGNMTLHAVTITVTWVVNGMFPLT